MADITLFEPHLHGGMNVGGSKDEPLIHAGRGSDKGKGKDSGGGGGLGRIVAVIAVIAVVGAVVAMRRRSKQSPQEMDFLED